MENIKASGNYSKQAHVKIPQGLYEEEHGRKGFFGKVSHIYHQHPPVNWSNIEGELKPRSLPDCFEQSAKNTFYQALKNTDLQIDMGQFTQGYQHFFATQTLTSYFLSTKAREGLRPPMVISTLCAGTILLCPGGRPIRYLLPMPSI